MIDDTKIPEGRAEAIPGFSNGSTPVGYCQECGRPLTADNVQRLANGVFCPGCSTHRHTAAGWQATNGAAFPGAARAGSMPPVAGEANPVLAGLLGFIPGVGAMFNGQYAKAAMHLIVFVVLVTLADNLNWVFYWLVWGWVFYQVFEAYHTARARRDGLPLPNPFGWNDIGERLGFNRTSSPPSSAFGGADRNGAASHRAGANWAPYVPTAATNAQPPVGTPGRVPYQEPARAVQDNPYAAPYETPKPPPQPPTSATFATTTQVPYVPTYVGVARDGALMPSPVPSDARRFPVGALWLIGLGVLFLLGNLLPGFHLSGRWMVPALLAGLAVWSALRRWHQHHSSFTQSRSSNLAAAMTGPTVLLTVAGLLAMDAGNVLTLRRSWPVLLVAWGSMLLVQRASATTLDGSAVEAAVEASDPMAPPVRSTSGTGPLGL